MKKNLQNLLKILVISQFMLACGSSMDKNLKQTNSKNIIQQKINDSISIINEQKIQIGIITNKFYSSLELTAEQNEKISQGGEVTFSLVQFNSYIDENSIFSKKRISNLTGAYHENYNINLINIDSLLIKNNIYEVFTTVKYNINEVGSFQNKEKIIFNITKGKFILNKWEDVKVEKMKIAEYDGLENFKKSDFYKIIGSVNK